MATYIIRIARRAGIVILFTVAAMLGLASGVFFAYAGDLPRISALDDYAPSTISRVYGAHGEIVGEFAIQRREVIPYEAISPRLKQAILAAEDATFEQHFGLSIPRIIVALMKDAIERRKAGGASTLTQQLTRKLFLTDEKTWERKIKEAILAIQIEKRYTKNEIFTLYCNQMYFGHGVYGVQAASRLYFAKSAKDLTLEEAALIAGILQGNVRQSPYVNMDAALRRRNYALTRMADVGYITPAEAEEARKKPIEIRGEPASQPSVAPYFLEDVRKELEARYGAKQLYENGLSVQTALDLPLQEAANRAMDDGLRRIDKRRGFRKPKRNIVSEGHAVETFKYPRWDRPMRDGDVVPAIVRSADAATIDARAGTLRIVIDRKGFAWAAKPANQLVSAGDMIEVRLAGTDAAAQTASGTLEQPPAVEGAILAIDNRTGQVKAMVGGYSFERSKFNRATQALRQVGSSFKPIVYTAAIDRGYTPASLIVDEPVSFPAGAEPAALFTAELRSPLRRPGHAAARARTVAQRPRGPGNGTAGATAGHRLREKAGAVFAYSALPAGRARRRRSDAARDHQRVRGVPESGRAHAAVLGAQGHRPGWQRARGESARAEGRHPRRHRLRRHQPAPRRGSARHGCQGGLAQLAGRRQDRHDR